MTLSAILAERRAMCAPAAANDNNRLNPMRGHALLAKLRARGAIFGQGHRAALAYIALKVEGALDDPASGVAATVNSLEPAQRRILDLVCLQGVPDGMGRVVTGHQAAEQCRPVLLLGEALGTLCTVMFPAERRAA